MGIAAVGCKEDTADHKALVVVAAVAAAASEAFPLAVLAVASEAFAVPIEIA